MIAQNTYCSIGSAAERNRLRKVNLVEKYRKAFYEIEKVLSVISPLIYTRLMIDLEDIAGMLCTNRSVFGRLYELTVKCEVIYRNGYDRMHYS